MYDLVKQDVLCTIYIYSLTQYLNVIQVLLMSVLLPSLNSMCVINITQAN